jgi:hypothetical protein
LSAGAAGLGADAGLKSSDSDFLEKNELQEIQSRRVSERIVEAHVYNHIWYLRDDCFALLADITTEQSMKR